MPDGGDLRIALENLMVDESYAGMQKELGVGPHVVMNVEDTGTGMPPDVVGRIFEPFYTTKEVGRGTGLGLSTVQGIVKSHGGVIKVYSEPGRGTTFRVYLPAYHAAVEAVEEGRPAGALVGHGELILVIDDEASIRDITRVTLESFGYEVVTASDGADALTRYLERKDAIRIVITDMMMPVMDGHATIRVLLRMNPTLRIIATSGLLAEEKALEYSQLKVRAFLTKPYTARTLLRTVARVLTDGEAPAS
jgi:CheY-like chemotaxis protein